MPALAALRGDGLRRDVLLALGFLLLWMTGFLVLRGNGWQPFRPESFVVCGAFTAVAIACSGTLPVIGLLTVALGYPAVYHYQLQSQIHLLPLLLTGFAASVRSALPARVVWTATLLPIALLSVLWPALIDDTQPDLSGAVLALFSGAAVCALGGTVAKARRQAAVLAERNAELLELRGLDAERAVIAERSRIARELHDIVAHALTAIIVRAQAADRVAETEPGAARDAVRWIATSGKEALVAIRQTVKVLRDPSSTPASRDPGPSLAVLPEMAGRLEEAGLSVRLLLPPQPPRLDPAVELAAVRIVQESLTNVLSHARAKSATVDVLDTPGALIVTVDDDGVGDAEQTKHTLHRSGGNGLLGMRERAATCGGDVEFTESPLGGWRVRAWLPKTAPEGEL